MKAGRKTWKNADSRRTLDPDFAREEPKLDRKKRLEQHHLRSSFSLAEIPPPVQPPHIRKDIQVSSDNTLARQTDPLSSQPPYRAYCLCSAHRYSQTNSSSVPYLPGSRDAPEPSRPAHRQNHMKSSIPYLSDDGYEPRYEPRNPQYQSFPIWLRDGQAEAARSMPRLSKAKSSSMNSSIFNPPAENNAGNRRLSNMTSAMQRESKAEQPLCPTRHPKPAQVTDQFSRSFTIANS